MKKVIAAMLLGIICMTECSINTDSNESRFFEISEEDRFIIVYDKTTGVEYAVSATAYNYGTVTLLVDTDGKPLIYEGAK
jgi:hypothetical protein